VLGPLNSLVWYVPSLRYTRGLGWRMHCGAEVTESSTNKQHHLYLSLKMHGRCGAWKPAFHFFPLCVQISPSTKSKKGKGEEEEEDQEKAEAEAVVADGKRAHTVGSVGGRTSGVAGAQLEWHGSARLFAVFVRLFAVFVSPASHGSTGEVRGSGVGGVDEGREL
jgi:hypothetical protein